MAKRGPKPEFARVGTNKKGAPFLGIRLDPDVYLHIKHYPTGKPREYVERLVREDAKQTGMVLGHGLLNQDVPGQLHLNEEGS